MEVEERLSSELEVPLKQVRGDIKQIAYAWDDILDYDLSLAKKKACASLIPLVRIYLRGKGYRMGNSRSFTSHSLKFSLTYASVIKFVIEAGRECFPILHSMGFSSWEEAQGTLRYYLGRERFDIIEEAETILKESEGT